MILVDTSVWIDYLRDNDSPATELLARVMAEAVPFGLTGIVFQEILQGARSPADFNRLGSYFGSQRFYHLRHPTESYEQAAQIYHHCRRRGVTPRSSMDCLIVQVALEHDLALLHSDRDFEQIAAVVPRLRLLPSGPL